jgi:hypothetical protein
VTLNAKIDLAVAFGQASLTGLTASLYADNAIESDPVFQPDLREFRLNTLPLRSERAIYFSLDYRFGQ